MQRHDKLLILSFLLLNLFSWVTTIEFKYGIPVVVKYVLSVTVLGVIIWYKLKNPFKPVPGGSYYPFITIFVLWSCILIIIALLGFNSMFYLQRILGQRFFLIPYILPVILLFTKFDIDFFGLYFRYTSIFIFFALIMQGLILAFGPSPASWQEQIGRIFIFDLGSGFLLLIAHTSRKRYIFYAVLVYFIVGSYLWMVFGRRGPLVEYGLIFVFMILIRLKSPFLKMADRMKIYYSGLVLVIVFIAFGYLLMSTYAFQRGFNKAGFEESRSLVFENFITDFNSTSDWVFGRGLDGRVLRTIIQGEDSGDLIENGFLHLVLKGGLIYLVPYVLILLRASYLGFFKSNNELLKALASLLLIYVFMMFYFNLPDYSSKFIMIWISASACFSPQMRNYSNEEIYKAVNFNAKAD